MGRIEAHQSLKLPSVCIRLKRPPLTLVGEGGQTHPSSTAIPSYILLELGDGRISCQGEARSPFPPPSPPMTLGRPMLGVSSSSAKLS